MSELRRQLRLVLADRHSPEASALFETLARYVHGRVERVVRTRYSDLLSGAEVEELVGEVLLQLMAGSLAQFRGESLPELFGFTRSICDRCVGRAARKRLRERRALDGDACQAVEAWNADLPRPDDGFRFAPASPLESRDEAWLLALFEAGSRAELAKRSGVSRAAVTQRVQRIRARIERMPQLEQSAAETWLLNLASTVASAGG